MKFYGNGIVWDGTADKPLCRFVDGEYKTTDRKVIAKLKALGYRCESRASNPDNSPAASEKDQAVPLDEEKEV